MKFTSKLTNEKKIFSKRTIGVVDLQSSLNFESLKLPRYFLLITLFFKKRKKKTLYKQRNFSKYLVEIKSSFRFDLVNH